MFPHRHSMPFAPFSDISKAQVASLTFLVYDICLTFDDEVNTIWSKPHNNWIKWQFLFTRYFALLVQIANRTIENVLAAHMGSATRSLKNWYLSQVVLGSVLMAAVEIVLMARVYALYNQNKYIKVLFLILLLAETIAVVVGVAMNLPGENFRPVNVLVTSPKSYMYFGISAIVSQITILCLTLIKYRMALAGGWGKIPIMTLMVRDGTVTFVLLLVVTTMTVVVTRTHKEYAPLGNSWFLSIVACSGCRLILNLQNFPISSEGEFSERQSVLLSTILDAEVDVDTEAPASDPPSHQFSV
ncbi:hypothetical protein CPC08DRAFT_702674 [Agrocybe pediades]|nr:hypothetical protein CPC08DRAFT_702674 [Agrocybe pediades]